MKADSKKPASKRRRATDIAVLEEKIEEIREREEARLIRAAHKVGYFRYRFRAAETEAMLKNAIAALDRQTASTLRKLEHRKTRASKDKRIIDARRKALLGAFLVAQSRHKPDLHAAIAPAIRTTLEHHPHPEVGQRNLASLEGFLSDPWHDEVSETLPDHDKRVSGVRAKREKSHRLILLGVWLLEQRGQRSEIDQLIATELAGFLLSDPRRERYKPDLLDLLSR